MSDVVPLAEDISRGRSAVFDGNTISKVLVRMPSDVTSMAAEAAQKAGTSLNNWTVTVLERALVNMRARQQKPSQHQDVSDSTGNMDPAQESKQDPRE